MVKAIEEIRAGDYVYSYNEGIGQSEERKVLQTFIHDVDEVLDIYLGNDTVITTTEEHPFYVNGKYINAGELKEGMLLMTNSCDKISIVKIVVRKLKEKIKVYNIEVDGNHNYFVGENKVLVHNKNIKNPQKQVGYDSDLGQEALKFRTSNKKNKITSADRNVAVFEFEENGDIKTKAFVSDNRQHAEQIGKTYFEENKMNKESVQRIFSERQPCTFSLSNKGNNCTLMIQENFPNAMVEYIVPYGNTIEDGVSARKMLKELLNENLNIQKGNK